LRKSVGCYFAFQMLVEVKTLSMLGISSVSVLCDSQEQKVLFLCLVSRRGTTGKVRELHSWLGEESIRGQIFAYSHSTGPQN
jgi:hypothetical protein